MGQDRETGAAGREYGLQMAKGLALLLNADLVSAGSNEAKWNGERAVIKSARHGTSSIGVTAGMLPRLDAVLAAFEDANGGIKVWRISAEDFRKRMYASRSGPANGRVQMISRSYARDAGSLVKEFAAEAVFQAGAKPPR